MDHKHKTEEELKALVEDFRLVECSAWKHKKSGNLYFTLIVCLREEDCVPVVVYRQWKGKYGPVPVYWTRPVSEFLEKFERHEGVL
jgi:hypothetical protein